MPAGGNTFGACPFNSRAPRSQGLSVYFQYCDGMTVPEMEIDMVFRVYGSHHVVSHYSRNLVEMGQNHRTAFVTSLSLVG